MKNITTYLLLFFILVLVVACQKEPNEQLPQSTGNKLKTYTEDVTDINSVHTVDSFVLAYDGSDRIISMTSVADTGQKFTYSYPSGNTIVKKVYIDGALSLHVEDFYVNNHVDSSFSVNDAGDTTTVKFIYNTAGQWAKQYEYDYSKVTGAVLFNTTNYTYDGGGNQVKEEDSNGQVIAYDFYTDKTYYHPMIGPAYIPVTKEYLIKTITVSSGGSVVETAAVSYTFDSKDRITSEKTVTDLGTVIIKRYTYY
ncbi:MAG: hypothetical protein QM764_18475 [Chitinophagaceae bacterium]